MWTQQGLQLVGMMMMVMMTMMMMTMMMMMMHVQGIWRLMEVKCAAAADCTLQRHAAGRMCSEQMENSIAKEALNIFLHVLPALSVDGIPCQLRTVSC